MATATVARPTQALRNRRDAPRPSVTKRQATMDPASESSAKKRKLAEPYVRDSQYILDKHKGKAPSFILHLHPTHFRFEGQDGSFSYDSPMRLVIDHLKKQTIPHELVEQLLSQNNVPWYDGCLIVEVHNHIPKAGKERRRRDSGADDGNVRFSMHNYNSHVTPSPMVPFPSKAKIEDTPEKAESSAEMPAPERPKDKEGPAIGTLVLHPTSLSQHAELLLLMNTPADQARGKKKSTDSATPASAQPPTPQLSVPPTPITQTPRNPLGQSQKMFLEPDELYSFQADMLLATEPPLFLDPVDNPQDAERVLELLQHPMHQEKPPSPKTRKRTTAEVAADDAQAAEAERRMLIMDERIKPAGAGTGANENQAAAASLGFSRFKTLEMVRQKHEEADRLKKEEEARAVMEKKQAEEQSALQQKQAQMAQRQRELLMAQQQQQQPNQQSAAMQMRAEQMRAMQLRAAQQQQQQQQAALMNGQAHGHPQQGNMMQNQQQNFPQTSQASMTQSSPVVRQQTPMMTSSPMVPQGGFPMAQTASQGAASPPRPTSATQNQMARQFSQQQQQGSRNNTPQIPQGTPAINQAMPNRQTMQTPRMQAGSPAAGMQQGTPVPVSMPMQTPQMGNPNQFTPEQMQMLAAQRAMSQSQASGGMQDGSPMQNLTPEQIQQFRNVAQQAAQHQQQQMHLIRQAQAAGNVELAQKLGMELQQRTQMVKQRQNQMVQQAAQMNARAAAAAGQAGSPGSMQAPTPQSAHAHPQQQGNMQAPNQMSQQDIATAQARAQQVAISRQQLQQNTQLQIAQQQLHSLVQQYGGMQNIPQQVINSLPVPAQQLLKQQFARQAQARQQQQMRAQAQQQQQQQNSGGREQVPGSQPNPQYMQQLRDNQAMLQQQMQQNPQNQQQQQGGGMNQLGMQSFTMNGMGGNAFGGGGGPGGQGQGQGQGGADLTQQFAAMQNALNRSSQGGMQ